MRTRRLLLALSLLSLPGLASAQKFFPDDPLWEEPPQRPIRNAEPRALNELLEAVSNIVGEPGERQPARGVIPAQGFNTLGEVMDGPWYINRHWRHRLTEEQLREGPGLDHPPSFEGKWSALVVKPFGLRPGILMRDSRENVYLLRFDPKGAPEMSTGGEMVSSRIFHALGYHVPQDYLVHFERDQLVASESGEGITSAGHRRDLTELDIDTFLDGVARSPGGGYRAVATLAGGEFKGFLGPYQMFGVRSDDPNDIIPHEHRRDLRGLFVFCAWLNHPFMRALSTLDAIVEDEGVPHIRHLLVDFVATLGGGFRGEKPAWQGNERLFPGSKILENIVGFGIYTPRWMRAHYPNVEGVGTFGYETFDPETWTALLDIAPFANRLPDDEFWAAKQVMAFTDEDIRTLVSTGQYSDPEASEWIARSLIERRDRIGRTYFAKVLPLDGFRVEGQQLVFDDLSVRYGFSSPQVYSVRWLELDNEAERLSVITGAESFDLPRLAREGETGTYVAARISGAVPDMEVTAYIRKETDGFTVVGIDRSWPGRVIADPKRDVDTGRSRYTDLSSDQKALFEKYAAEYAERRGREVSPQEYFDSLTISERTTFDAVTHALLHSPLTDEQGNSLGHAFDLVEGIERIAGQYYGRSGDQQFRLYVRLVPGARETLETSREFFFGHENTVYHPGYPTSFRQEGKEPTMQFSVSEDGTKADIDVDYRSSKSPQALFNGHLTSANSDVRAGDNLARHNGRWQGFVGWWQELFGRLGGDNEGEGGRDLLAREVPEVPTPLPPNRPPGAPIAEIQDAAQEFLTDWLVRQNVDEAMNFLAPDIYACVNLNDDAREESLDRSAAAKELRTLMRYSVDQLGERRNLTEAIDAVQPADPKRVVVAQPFDSDFTVLKMTEQDASQYLCGQNPDQPAGAEYYGVIFRFKRRDAGILGLLFRRVTAGPWSIVSYRVFEP